jgi:hypothetical protein
MIFTNKLLPVALIAALVGGSVGALVMHSRNQTVSADNSAGLNASRYETTDAAYKTTPSAPEYSTTAEQNAYKTGFADGFQACSDNTGQRAVATNGSSRYSSRNVSRSSTRRVYYDYSRPQGRSFWQKHRDKLTVAMGTGAGAVIGGLIGGKKGAAIGALSGAGGSALYTYKLRRRSPRY